MRFLMILRLAVIGFGNVGQEFARLLLSKRDWLLRAKGLDVEVLAIATRNKGPLISKKSLDLEKALAEIKKGSLRGYGPESTGLSVPEIIESCDADVMVELTTLEVKSGQPAIDHIKSAMDVGMDVITANKGPLAFAYEDLRDRARSRGVHFRFEGTVMDGTPIFSLVERTLPGCQVVGLEGIVNSTTNYILTEMSKGKPLNEAVREAQRKGIAEADPSLDIDGWDAAAKITALANVLMDAGLDPTKVHRRGIREVTSTTIAEAAGQDKKVKLIARAKGAGESVRLEVGPELVGPDSPFWSVEGTSSALTIRTDLMGDVTLLEGGPGLAQTAYAVFSDMILVVDAIRSGSL